MSNNGFVRSTAAYGTLLGIAALGVSLSYALTAPAVRDGWAAVRDPDRAPDRLVGACVQLLSAAALTAALLWVVVSAVVCLTDLSLRLRRPSPALPRPSVFRPRFLRVLVAIAVSSAAAAPGAHADRGPALPGRLDGLPLPDRTYGVVRTHEVGAGESLWTISTDLVRDRPGPGADRAGPAVVARTWPRLYRLNRHRIGADPGLIRPGSTLRLPARAPTLHTTTATAHPDTQPGATR